MTIDTEHPEGAKATERFHEALRPDGLRASAWDEVLLLVYAQEDRKEGRPYREHPVPHLVTVYEEARYAWQSFGRPQPNKVKMLKRQNHPFAL